MMALEYAVEDLDITKKNMLNKTTRNLTLLSRCITLSRKTKIIGNIVAR